MVWETGVLIMAVLALIDFVILLKIQNERKSRRDG